MADEPIDDGGAYIGFRGSNIKLDDPPAVRDEGVLMLKYRCVKDGHSLMEDGELRPIRSLKILAVWRPGEKPPSDDQPAMIETDGSIADDEEGEDEDGADGA